ncbi:thiol:disulfide interchange protein TlpA [Prosthecomicrobium pneumaticum]|uniref:Thiol-disulfide isomerase/thioredoxin n=1 Tax=Prosthecomicrobium pneumaticum TaxID=81895 RepID=A0A7W9L3V8_9HYPH|nr:TlpA disulfide reductase family protein [Prosthecomicrobium pneumaticum]MBB5754956.1 thiol-disulfide isomerase/thioredoxin [Prosthecomicrobium pneumaticum]
MDETRAPGKRRRTFVILALAAVAGIGAGVAGVYVTREDAGNGAETVAAAPEAACPLAKERAEGLKPLATGEVAAFQVAETPQRLTDLAFETPAGQKLTLADFAGRTVLLNLWATWCAPCRKEMPALDALEKAEGSEKFEVVTVSIDTGDPKKPDTFLDEIGVAALVRYRDPTTGVFGALKSRGMALGLPTSIIVDPDGCSVGVMSGPAEWDAPEAVALIRAVAGPPPEDEIEDVPPSLDGPEDF